MTRPVRKLVQRTVFFCVEGNAEVALINYLKTRFAPRNCGVIVTVKNAHGKGAQNVIDCAVRNTQSVQYDLVCVVLDTDTDWNETIKAKAKRKRFRVFDLNPCLEAVLCRALGLKHEGLNTAQLKKLVETKTGSQAHNDGFFEHEISKVHDSFISQPEIAGMIESMKRQ